MQNNPNNFIKNMIDVQKVNDTLYKIFSGYYVTDRERKEAIKSYINLLAEDEKAKTFSIDEKNRIDNIANSVKILIENLKEVNF